MKKNFWFIILLCPLITHGQIDTIKIAKQSQIKKGLVEWVEKLNGCSRKYFVGKKLLVPRDSLSAYNYQGMSNIIDSSFTSDSLILVDKSKNRLGCYINRQLVYWCPVTLGTKGHPTISGGFRIIGKFKMLVSKKYGDVPMPYSLQFSGNYCIHQGPMPGHRASHGCVRVFKKDAIWLYKWSRVGVRVILIP